MNSPVYAHVCNHPTIKSIVDKNKQKKVPHLLLYFFFLFKLSCVEHVYDARFYVFFLIPENVVIELLLCILPSFNNKSYQEMIFLDQVQYCTKLRKYTIS